TVLRAQLCPQPLRLPFQPFSTPGPFQGVGSQVGNRRKEVEVMIVEAAVLIINRQIDYAEHPSINNERGDEQRLWRSDIIEEQWAAFISRPLNEGTIDLNGCI